MLLLQRKEHTNDNLTPLVSHVIKCKTQLEEFIKVKNRCEKIDMLDEIRKQLEPKK